MAAPYCSVFIMCDTICSSPWNTDTVLKFLKASQSGYAVDYMTQGGQGGFPGNFLNQNTQNMYSRFGSGNDFMSQVCH